MNRFLVLILVMTGVPIAACGGGSQTVVSGEDTASDVPSGADLRGEVVPPEDVVPLSDRTEGDLGSDLSFDARGETVPRPECAPGEGCFLDKCDGNADCLSGWCVEHMGDGVCTDVCQEECPPGWSCKLLGGGGTDPTYACVSNVSNLCKPCATNADCKSPGAQDDVCLDYGPSGSFCGGACASKDDCPWGFSCVEATTVDGMASKQCVSDAGVCPCSAKSAKLGLWTPCSTESEFGVCKGKRTCTQDGLTECDAPVAVSETCNGTDDDCDGDVDEPVMVGGNLVNLCDDENPCTVDTCSGAEGCAHDDLDAGECMDGDACTVGDHCDKGSCVGQFVDCDDSNPCTEDSCSPTGGCEHQNNTAKCDDGNACTVADECVEGACTGYAVNCDCQEDFDCAALEDGNACNGTLRCAKETLPYQCQVDPATVVACEPLAGAVGQCNVATCDPASGKCGAVAVTDGILCDDGNPCTVTEICQSGQCSGGVAVNCNDGNPCTEDSCAPGDGCSNVPNTSACEDGNVCTAGDICSDGICKAGNPVSCDDGNVCTADSCVAGKGCVHEAVAGACSDANECTQGDHCAAGKCVFDSAVTCDDGNGCTTDSCNPASGCAFTLNTAPCNDGNLCTTGDHCQLGMCIAGGTLTCNDGNSCTDDSCEPGVGCSFVPNKKACDDGSKCSVGDACSQGWCLPGPALACDDGKPCTDDSCDPKIGCVHSDSTKACSDGNACTVNDLCGGGQCKPGLTLDCSDGSTCTQDSCDPATGCKHEAIPGSCDDANACTVGDACAAGVCVPGGALTCNDANPCTDDSCAPASGCLFSPNSAACSDGSACTAGDVCSGGQCKAGEPVNCNDGNPCTDDSCNPLTGCNHTNVADGVECGAGLVCNGGKCTSCGQLHGTVTLSYTGSKQTFTVPQCITAVTVTAYGAEAGQGQLGASGKGGKVVATINVTPGETLSVYVGGKGTNGSGSTGGNGGFNGGGKGNGYSNTCYTGGGGGGASDVRRGGDALSDRVVIAGGGGGGAGDPSTCNASWGGAGGGLTGQNAQPSVQGGIDSNGKGGTQSAGGGGGSWSGGQAGTLGTGGNAGNAGGGGGGGLYGGGGGGHGGGGGGSNYAIPGASNVTHEQGGRTGNGEVVISW